MPELGEGEKIHALIAVMEDEISLVKRKGVYEEFKREEIAKLDKSTG